MPIITLLIILTSIIYCHEVDALQKSINLSPSASVYRRMTRYLLVTAWSLFFLFQYMPLPLCYVIFYMILCIGGLGRCDNKKYFYMINMQFVYFASINLVVLGAMALVNGADINVILLRPNFQGFSIFLTMLINALGIHLMRNIVKRKTNLFFVYDRTEFWFLVNSMWFWLAFVYVDSIPSMFRLPTGLVSLFLIGSNILILSLLAFFHIHVYRIAENAYLEEERVRLQIEEREQRLRTAIMEKDAYTDQLTGAFSRVYVQKRMEEMVQGGGSFSLVYIDLDSLKQINDTLGHVQGDTHLELFAHEMKNQLRNEDILARIGGDEFLILMPDCSELEAKQRLEERRKQMETDQYHKISYSYGVVCVPAQTEKPIAEYLKEADRRMYEDKKTRR